MSAPERQLLAISSATPEQVYQGLRSALFDNGPAVFPIAPGKITTITHVDWSVVAVIETSGSTAQPKTVWYPKKTLIASAQMVNNELGEGTWWLALPTHYIAGLQVLTRSLTSGTPPLFASKGTIVDAITADRQELAEAKASGQLFTSLVPTQLHQLLHAAEAEPNIAHTLQLFDRILVGGQRIDSQLVDRASRWGLKVVRTYGSAETSGGCVWDGIPLAGVQLDTVDGQVAISGPMLAGGYLNNPEKTAASFVEKDGARWFISDDRGDIVEGQLSIRGRIDDVMISGGVKVDLAEVERFLTERQLVSELAVVARPDDTWGEIPVVVSTSPIDFEALSKLLVGQFGKAMSKIQWHQVPHIPTTATGKVDKPALRTWVSGQSDYPGSS